jgi:hypothetical protein
MALLSLRGRHAVSPDVSLDAVLFYRPSTVHTINGDGTEYGACEADGFEQVLCAHEGEGAPVRDQFGLLVPVSEDDPLDGTDNASSTRTHGWGGGIQATVTRPLAGRGNHFITGVSLDGARSRYESDTELARLTSTRGTAGAGLFDSGAGVRLRTRVRHAGVYVANFFDVAPGVTLMGAARYNHSVVRLRDQLGDDLTGDHRFARLNPGAGVTYTLPGGVTAFGSVSMSSRVPAPSELGCADPDDPCRLPNAFVADPPLEQVVARTWEGGARGGDGRAGWSASLFRTQNRDDIIFISSGALSSAGHFANVGRTLRRGLEVSVSGVEATRVRWSAAYTYLRATFDTALTLSSPNHPDAVDGEIQVARGHSIPGVPRHQAKGSVSIVAGRVSAGASLVSMSSQFLRGDEANRLEPVARSTIVHLSGGVALHRRVRIVARMTNVFGATYSTFGLLGEADEVLGDAYDDVRFVSPGAPRAVWAGVEMGWP